MAQTQQMVQQHIPSYTIKIGEMGEKLAFDALVERGYAPQPKPDFRHKGCDMTLNGLPVEVKFANLTASIQKYTKKDGTVVRVVRYRHQWNIHTTSLNMVGEWILILIAVDDNGEIFYFVLPGELVERRNQIQITSHPNKYRGWLAAWLEQWPVIDYLSDRAYSNRGPLYPEWLQKQKQGVLV